MRILRGLRAAAIVGGISLLLSAPILARAQTPSPDNGTPPRADQSKSPSDPGGRDATGGNQTDGSQADGSVVSPQPEDAPLEWDFSWQGWDGLHMSVSRKMAVPDRLTNLPLFEFEEVKLSGNIGARLELDAATFATNGNLTGFDSGVELRRARITARGDPIVAVPFSYRVDLGYVPNKFTVSQAYIEIPNVPYLGSVKIGQFKPVLGLQVITSSWNIPFMEPAAPLQALVPGSQPGVQIGRPYLGGRGTWALGLYASAVSGEYGSASQNFGNAIGRVTWLGIDRMDPDRPSANQYLHLGLSANAQYSGNGEVRYRSRPESYIAPYVIDTDTIDASKAATVGAELAWVNGPFAVQAEYVRSAVEPSAGGTLQFYGFYGFVSWYLTGESRPYDREAGKFARLVPLRSFAWGKEGGWGALEAAARFSYTDLNDGNVRGGRLSMLMTSLNWYLQPHLTWMLDFGVGNVSDGASDGRMVILQTRMGVDF
jgi:phosphate-selective porin OprO/OprP